MAEQKLTKSQQRQSLVDAYNNPPYMQKLRAVLNRGADSQPVPEVMHSESDEILNQAGIVDEEGLIAQLKMENLRKKMIEEQQARSNEMRQLPAPEIPSQEVYSAVEPDDVELQREILRKRAGY